jgi:hypothetical protein
MTDNAQVKHELVERRRHVGLTVEQRGLRKEQK